MVDNIRNTVATGTMSSTQKGADVGNHADVVVQKSLHTPIITTEACLVAIIIYYVVRQTTVIVDYYSVYDRKSAATSAFRREYEVIGCEAE